MLAVFLGAAQLTYSLQAPGGRWNLDTASRTGLDGAKIRDNAWRP